MLRLHPLRRSKRALGVALLAAVGIGVIASAATPAGAVPATEAPATANVQINVLTPTDDLVAGNTVTFNVASSGGVTLSGVEAKLCANGFSSYDTSTYGFSGTNVRCAREVSLNLGTTTLDRDLGTAGVQNPTYRIDPQVQAPGTTTSPDYNFVVGTGVSNWVNAAGNPGTLTCSPASPCDMVVKVDHTGAGGTTYYIQPLNFLAAPAAPVLGTATAGSTQVALDWNDVAGAADYDVCVNTSAVSGLCTSPINVATSNATVTGLGNFTTYYFTVRANNAAGTSPLSNELSATPGPAGPLNLTGSPGDTSATLNWQDPASPGFDGFRITVSPLPASGPCASGVCPLQPDTANSYVVTGLSNGTPYTFTVAARYGAGNFSSESNSVAITPGGAIIYQTLNVTRPTGTLVISQRCSGLPTDPRTGDFDPSNPDLTLPYGDLLTPATRCEVNLHGPRLSHLVNNVTTADGRTVYDLNTVAGNTTVSSATAAFVANDLGQLVRGTGIPAGTRIASVVNATTATLSSAPTSTLDDGELTIIGRTITAPAGTFVAGDVNKDLQGIEIPGGSIITAAGDFGGVSYADLSQPANNPSTVASVRIWDEGPTPARLVTSGPNAGAFLQATGKMAQVYVVDYRNADAGWTATGQVDQFCDGSGVPTGPANNNPAAAPRECLVGDNTFSGNRLGWTPKVRRATPGMAVTAGPLVNPGGNLGAAPQTLASAPAGQGLGMARLDADFNLLIPVAVDGGNYQSTLTLTVA